MRYFISFCSITICFIIQTVQNNLYAQLNDSSFVNHSRRNTIIITGASLYATSLFCLSEAWYKNQGTTSFHFYNDNSEWNQVDKLGHTFSAYQISKLSTSALEWANISDRRAFIYGSLLGLLYQTPIEILDGFSNSYGASWGDMCANIFGSGLWLGQNFIWKEERIHIKYSFHRTSFASINPNLLGDGWSQEWLKDYNGQTYWLSFDLYSLFGKRTYFPKWLNLTLGYGTENMVRANERDNNNAGYYSYRQYYFGLDLDLSHIKSKYKLINTLIYMADMIKIPGPTVEFNNRNGWSFHAFYY